MEKTHYFLKRFLKMIVGKLLSIEDHFLFSGIVVFVVVLAAGTLSYIVYQSYDKTMNKALEVTAARIDNLLSNTFDETNHLMIYMGKQIAQHGSKDLRFIDNLLKNTSGSEYKTKNLLSWSLFDWVDSNDLQLVNRITGISCNPPNMSHREYTWKSRKRPWTLQMSKPAIGTPSGIGVIPAGTGIVNNKGEFLGILVVGFNISELTATLEKTLTEENASFIVLDEDFNIVLKSSDNSYLSSHELCSQENLKTVNFNTISGPLFKPVQHNGITYSVYRKLEKYPYIILTGFNNYIYVKQLCTLVFPTIIQITSMGLFTLVLVYISRKRLIKSGEDSDKAKQGFIALINQKLQTHMDVILQYSDILMRFFKGEIEIGINTERQIEFMSHIYKAAVNLKSLTSNTLELTRVDLNAVIKYSISICYKTVLQKSISIKVNLEPSLPFLEADELCIKQIIVSLLSSSINYIPAGRNIWISTYFKILDNKKTIALLIRDNGFGLNESDIIRINKKLEKLHINEKQTKMDLDLETIIELIKLHNGNCEVENIEGEGRIITILFPIREDYFLEYPSIASPVLSKKS